MAVAKTSEFFFLLMFENKLAYISHTQLCKSEILSVYVYCSIFYSF